jgi:hypothetical protein
MLGIFVSGQRTRRLGRLLVNKEFEKRCRGN